MIPLAIQSVVSEIKSLGVSGWKELLEVVWPSAACRDGLALKSESAARLDQAGRGGSW